MFKQEIFHEIFEENPTGEKYYIIDNGYKIWIIPSKNMKQGYGIYQVSSFRGKLVKYVLPKLKHFSIIRKAAACREVYLNVSRDVQNVIGKHYKGEYQCSVYYGNLDTEQNYKATIQVYNKKEILFYIKVTKSNTVKDAIWREISFLEELENKGIENTSKVVALESVNQWIFFLQSAKSVRQQNVFKIKEAHWAFLESLYEKSKIKCKYEESDICKYIKYLEGQMQESPRLGQYEILKKAIQQVENWLKEDDRIYSSAHGDFTPWNMYCTKEDLYVFDFEYCMKRTIPFMDYFHFICQTNLVVHNMNIKKTMQNYERDKVKLERYIDDTDKAFAGYLLFVISFYIMRKEGVYDTDNKQFQYRLELLKELVHN